MADQRLRELERRFQETGDPEDEAAFLAHAVRTEAFARDRIAVAAWLGHPAARAALGDTGQPPPDDDREVWIRTAFHPVERVVLACFPHMPDKDRYPGPARRALAAARAWLREPSDATQEAASYVARDFWSDPKTFMPGEEPTFYLALHAAHCLVRAIGAPADPDPEREAAARDEHDRFAAFLASRERPVRPYVAFATRPQSEEALRYAFEASCGVLGLDPAAAKALLRSAQLEGTVPWLLSRSDPLRERAHVPRGGETRLRAAEAAAEAAPGELAVLEQLAAVCDEVGWTWDGKTLGAWTEQLCGDWNLAKVAVDHLAPLGPRAVPAALAALQVQRYQNPGFGVSLLRLLGTDAAAAVPTLLDYLERGITRGDSGPGSWIMLLGQLRAEPAVPLLVQHLGDTHGTLAGQALLEIGPPAVLEPLRAVLAGAADAPSVEDPALCLAAFALAELGEAPERIEPILARILREHPWRNYRKTALSGLFALDRAGGYVAEIVEWLQTEDDDVYKHDPIQALGMLGAALTHPEARAALEPYVTHEHRNLRRYAEAAITGRRPEGVSWSHGLWNLPRR